MSTTMSPVNPQMQQRRPPTSIQRERPPVFDDLYDVTDDESEEVPLSCSASVKKHVDAQIARTNRNRYPSLIIPSPSAWPTIQKLKSAITPLSPTGPMLSPTPNMLSMLAAQNLQVPATSATPSLDGSMSSEDMEHLSCPSTPDLELRQENGPEWTPTVQLQPRALETLHHLSMTESEAEAAQALELPETEMEQVYHAPHPTSATLTPGGYEGDTVSNPLSPLSIPSPGGFFSSLGGSARHTWSVSKDEPIVPSTCVAENFYGVPWRLSSDEPVPQVIEVTVELPPVDEPPTAKLTVLTGGTDSDEVAEILPSQSRNDYNPNYDEQLKKVGSANLDRTGCWLSAQFSYLAAIRDELIKPDLESPSSPSSHKRQKSLESDTLSPSKKSVRFLDDVPRSPASVTSDDEEKEVVFAEAFQYLWEQTQAIDAFIHRQTRGDAMHVNRRHLASSHRNQLLGRYFISQVERPSPPRPVSSFYTDDPTVLKERIARALKERQALEQVRPAVWVLQALKYLNGGKFLSPMASKTVNRSTDPKILDVGGHFICDWAWQVAFDFQYATVHTVNTERPSFKAQGPVNHKTSIVPNYWTFPFPSCHFDLISLRSLFTLLKTIKPVGSRMDELDLCLRECYRCLKPGGCIDFSVLDADIIHAGPLAQAMSAEFSFNLKTRGYDPTPTKSFLPRLRKAGFTSIKRSWTLLPMGQTASKWNESLTVGLDAMERSITPEGDVTPTTIGSTKDISALTGLVGAWSWERWMIKLQVEMDKDEERLLEGVPAVLEESFKNGAGWRQLTGCARKTW